MNMINYIHQYNSIASPGVNTARAILKSSILAFSKQTPDHVVQVASEKMKCSQQYRQWYHNEYLQESLFPILDEHPKFTSTISTDMSILV